MKNKNCCKEMDFLIAIHETAHTNEIYSGLTKDSEERVVSQYTDRTNDLINFYHNQPGQSDNVVSGFMSDLVSLSFANSGFRDEYLSANNHINNLYNNSTANVTQSSLAGNNSVAQNVDRSKVETYQKDVHKYLTKYLAENAGFTSAEATEIARGNYRVDTRLLTQPLTIDTLMPGNPKEDYHFTSSERREEMRQAAYESGDLKLFGQYLHAFQDSFSHQKDGVPYSPGVGHLNILEKEWGAHVDRTYERPYLADQMAKATYSEMQDFLRYKNTNWAMTPKFYNLSPF